MLLMRHGPTMNLNLPWRPFDLRAALAFALAVTVAALAPIRAPGRRE